MSSVYTWLAPKPLENKETVPFVRPAFNPAAYKNEYESLNKTERQIAGFCADCYTRAEIAAHYQISYKALDAYLTRIYEKLKINSVSELLRIVIQFEPNKENRNGQRRRLAPKLGRGIVHKPPTPIKDNQYLGLLAMLERTIMADLKDKDKPVNFGYWTLKLVEGRIEKYELEKLAQLIRTWEPVLNRKYNVLLAEIEKKLK